MEVRWLNIFLRVTGLIAALKNRLVESKDWYRILGYSVALVVLEIIFSIISIPLYLMVSPKKVQEKGFIIPRKERGGQKEALQTYTVRRKVSIATFFSAGGVIAAKTIFVGIVSFYLFGAQALLAATQSWTFDTPSNYTYDSAKIEVTSGVARLKDTSSPASGGTTNSGFGTDTTGWTFNQWLAVGGVTNTGAHVATGGNPGGYVDILIEGKKNNTLAAYWEQSFTTTVSSPTATLDLDWIVTAFDGSNLGDYHLYAFVDSASGNPTVGNAVWDSGTISSTTSWASATQVDISSSVTAAGTYYVKVAAWANYVGNGTVGDQIAGFDNVVASWSGASTPAYATDDPTIYPTSSLSPGTVSSWNSFTETATKNGGEVYYQLSDDDGSTWQYWNGSAWASAGAADYNMASVVGSNIGDFSTSANKIMWKAFLSSDGSQQVIVDTIEIDYTLNDLPDINNLLPAQDPTTGSVYVNYDLADDESDPSSLATYEYSLTGAFGGEESTMTPDVSDGNHDGISGLTSSPGGTAHTFVWDAYTDLGAIYDATVYVRLTANDGIGDGLTTTSSSFPVDYVIPVVSNVTASQTLGTTDVVITYDLADNTATDLLVEIDISEDSGATWDVMDTSVTGAVGSGQSTGSSQTITWDAGTDFDEQDQTDIQVRVRATDKFQNAGTNVASSDFALETVNPVTNVTADLQAQPNAGDTTVLIGGSFTETNPDTNDFYVALNGGAYTGATAGDSDTATPSNQATATEATLDGNDYISGVKIMHTDDFGQTVDNENLSPATLYKYVKPYTPQDPSLSNPITTQLDLTINPHASEASDLEYAINETTSGSFVQAGGTLGASPVWRTTAQWGTITVTGLSSPVANYIFKVKSRNPSDAADASSSESAYSATAQITNTAPSIAYDAVAQTTDGTRYVTIDYTGTDGQGDINNLTTYEYSQDNATWFTLTEKSGVGSEGVSSLVFLPGGSAHVLAWDSGTDLSGVEDASVYVRLQATDTLASSTMSTSSAFEVDNISPVVSNVSASQDTGARTVTISYDLADANNSTVELDISEDGGSTWTVTDTSVSGDVGAGVTPGAGKSISWNVGSDFDDEYQLDMKVRVRALDAFGNQGSDTESSNFTVDTHDPEVLNVTASQDSAVDTFTFEYDVSEDAGNVTVGLEVSSNGGSTWTVPITSASGDLGAGITPGASKTITWDGSTDYNGFEEQDMRIRITATDSFTNAGVGASSNFNLDTWTPRVTSVNATQIAGSTNVSISYSLADQNTSLVEIDISDDSGSTWTVLDSSLSGDIGLGITAGSKSIIWDANTDFDNQTQNDMRVRVRAKDNFEHQSANTSSSDFSLDTLDPATNVTADLQAQPNAGDTTVLIGGSFTETNPDTNEFYVELNDGSYTGATAGDANTASPSNQATATEVTLDGNDYISAVKIAHTDDFGQTVDNENASPSTSYKYVKPYTPDAPSVDNPTVGTVDVTVVKNSSETAGLEYAIYETSQAKYVQANGTLGASAVWQALGTGAGSWGENSGISGKVTVGSLANDSYTYEFKTVSRNTSDVADSASSESALSGGTSSVNQSPVIVIDSVVQTTDGTKYVTIDYTGSDLESESSNLIIVQYSTDNSSWFTMTEKAAVGSDGTSGLAFSSSGTAHDFMWDVNTDLPNTEDSTTYVRLQANDATTSGAIVTSDPFTIDIKNPVISALAGNQVTSLNNVDFTYTLTDVSSSTVEIDISEDSGSTWAVTDTSSIGDIGASVTPGAGKTITWAAGTDFNEQEQSDMRVRARALDAFGNQGTYASSSDFALDTKNPVVTNVSASQDSGANTVTITYDISDANNSAVAIDISEDGGSTWTVTDTSSTGDVGAGVTPGTGKSISWDASADFPGQDQSDIRVRLRATDIFANTAGAVESANFSLDTLGPSITNVSASQTLSSENVVITYDLVDSVAVDVEIDISEDSGSTWTVTDTSVTGDVGSSVTPGTGKAITWDAGTDFNLEDQSDIQVRVRGIDSFTNSSGNVASSDFSVDTLAPSTNATADLQAQPDAGDTTVLIGGSFTESNPDTNDFFVAINGGAYASSTAGGSDTSTPSNQATTVGATLDGNDYVSKVKIAHTDDYAHSADNENLSPSTAYKYVKPYTPQAPTVNNPQNTSVDVAVNAHASETSGLSYAIYENTTAQYVQTDGSLGASAVWRTVATWGTTTVIGLTSPVAQYGFQVKSRNSSDTSFASSSESALSSVGAISNSAPSINITSAAQQTSTTYALIDYNAADTENDTNNLTTYEYSRDNSNWFTMTEKAGVGSDGVSGLVFASGGSSYTFGWDIATDLPNTGDPTVYVRIQSTDTLANSNLAVSSAFAIDTLGPVISNITTGQTPGTNTLTFGYDLIDDSVTGNTVALEISSDSGATWVVPVTTLSGAVGSSVTAGVGKSITWDASADFDDQENSTMKLRFQGTDEYGNVGSYYQSTDFTVDSKDPVVSNVLGVQTGGTSNIVISYDLSDATASGHNVEIDISDDSGATWTVTDTSLSGAVGAGQSTGSSQTITWDAGTDFDAQYEADMRVRVRSLDYYGNQGAFVESADFGLDTADPVVSNLVALQGAGVTTVTMTYDLSDDVTTGLSSSIDISEDGGVSWTVTDTSVTGDIGTGLTAGSGKTVTWDADADFAGQDVSNMRVRLASTDSFGNTSALFESADFAIDTAAPSGLASLSTFSTTATTATMNWTAVTDTNFDHYEIWYSATQSDAQTRTGTALEWDAVDDPALTSALTSSTVITGVDTTADLFVKIWAIDSFGNEVTIDDVNVFTVPAPAPAPVEVSTSGGSGRGLGVFNPLPTTPILEPIKARLNYTNVTVIGLADPGNVLHLYDNGNYVSELDSVADSFGRFEETFTFTEGIHYLAVQAIDGNQIASPFSEVVTFIVDLSPPEPTEVVVPGTEEVSDKTPVLIGLTEPNASVEIILDGTDTFIVKADADGRWSLILPTISALDIGKHEFTIRVIDEAENVSETSSVTIDVIPEVVVAPLEGTPVSPPLVIAEPIVPTLDLLEDLLEAVELPGLPRPEITQAQAQVTGNTFRFAGTAIPNSEVAVYVHSTQALAYFTESDDDGVWTVDHSQEAVELAEGDHSIYAVAVDSKAKVKTQMGSASVFTVKKNLLAIAFSYMNLYTTVITLVVLAIALVWLMVLKKRGVENV